MKDYKTQLTHAMITNTTYTCEAIKTHIFKEGGGRVQTQDLPYEYPHSLPHDNFLFRESQIIR